MINDHDFKIGDNVKVRAYGGYNKVVDGVVVSLTDTDVVVEHPCPMDIGKQTFAYAPYELTRIGA